MQEKEILLNLPVSGVQMCITALGKMPHDDVRVLIDSIINQSNVQLMAGKAIEPVQEKEPEYAD